MFRLDNKVAAITGGGSGIGRAVAKVFAQQGAVVYIIDLSAENGQAVLAEVEAEGGQGFAYACDVSNQQQVDEVFSKIEG
ncbi:MAG: short-chain dehydrogenase [Segetibacter sp.]|nr:short-chain dehydrogenase [Segetibacter sp.]